MKKLIAWTVLVAGFYVSSAQADLPDFTELVEKQAPSVVVVTTEATMHGNDDPFGYMQNDPMLEWFKRRGFFGATPQRPQKARGLGSGFIVGSDGYILTNAHVVDKSDTITVKLLDKREFKADLIGMDRRTDVALLKIKADGLPRVATGSAEKLKVGAWVVAIGASLGFENTVTAGIVSAKERINMHGDDDSLVPFIQHSAPINQGNSGGPLFNIHGEVVGINSRIYTPNQGFVGISFSIPIDLAMNVAQQLKENGKVSRGKLGVALQPMTQALASSFGLQSANGAIVAKVLPGTAAEKAGLRVGDVILAVNDTALEKPADLSRQIASSRAGQQVKLKVLRDRQSRQVDVVLDEAVDDEQPMQKSRREQSQKEGRSATAGLLLEPVPVEKLRRLKIEFGLQVLDTRGPAVEAGIQAGDIIVGVVGEQVRSLQEFERLLKPGAQVALQIMRGDGVFFAALTVPAGK